MARLAALSAIVVCTLCTAAYAAGDDQPPQVQPPAAARQDPKEPPPPMFPRHRRGIYKNTEGLEVIDATPQSPPLETDDASVPDKGQWEINLSTFAALSKEARGVDLLLVDVNYGLLPKVAGRELPTQLKLEFPVAADSVNHDPFTFGVGAAKAGVKFNVYANERFGLSLSVYPQLAFAPSGGLVEKGLAEPGQLLLLPLIVSKEFHDFTFVANGGVEKPFHDPEGVLEGVFGVGFGRAITRTLAAMIEIRSESGFAAGGDHLVFSNLGLMQAIGHIVVYTRVGHSLASNDAVSHTYFGIGMKLMVELARK